jgi:hypothetical protein
MFTFLELDLSAAAKLRLIGWMALLCGGPIFGASIGSPQAAAAGALPVRLLDPIASPDPIKARAAMEDAAFCRDRLRTVLPRLHVRLKQVEAAEYVAKWEPDFKRVEAQRDALAGEMREVYPAAVAQLGDLFERMAQCDRECSRINRSAPPGDRRRLLRVELTARGVEGLLQPDVWIAEMLRLPFFWRDSGPIYAWPPPEETPARQLALGIGLSGHASRRPVRMTPLSIQREGERVVACYAPSQLSYQKCEAAVRISVRPSFAG